MLFCVKLLFFFATACCVFFLPLPPAWWGERLGRTVIQTETVLMNHLCHSVIQWSWKIKQQFQLTLSLWLFFLLLLLGEKFYFNPLEAIGMKRISMWAGCTWKHSPEIRTVSMKCSILSGAGHAGCSREWFSRACNFGINGPQGNFFLLGWKRVYSFKKWHWQFLFTLVAITQDVSIILFKWGFFLCWIVASALQ